MRHRSLLLMFLAAAGLSACSDDNNNGGHAGSGGSAGSAGKGGTGGMGGSGGMGTDGGAGSGGDDMAMGSHDVDVNLKAKVQNIVFIYMENRSFDNMYGLFPGANGIPGVNPTSKGTYTPQIDRIGDGSTPLANLPPAYAGVTAGGVVPAISATLAKTETFMNKPFSLEQAYADYSLDLSIITQDPVHRFFENQMQIDGGKNDKVAALSNTGGLIMGYYDGSSMAMWALAQQYVLADNFFMGAFGGSFLNHQYLVCGCAPEFPGADTVTANTGAVIAAVDADPADATKFTHNLTLGNPAVGAMTAAATYTANGPVAPKNYFGDGKYYGINTLQPPYQPSAAAPPASDSTHLTASNDDSANAHGYVIPPQTATTIGDQLNAKGVSWAWYSGAWNAAVAATTSATRAPGNPFPGSANAAPNFQYHHQPFNYYQTFDPVAHADARKAHLKDYDDMVKDAAAGKLPSVVFYKPEGDLNQHGGYASITTGDQHIAALVARLQASPQWKNMVIVITYDEHGGWYDHVAPPKGDLLGPGTRIPALIISPLARKGTVDHTQYDTASILRLIDRRFGIDPLPGVSARDAALKAAGGAAMGDLTNALQLD